MNAEDRIINRALIAERLRVADRAVSEARRQVYNESSTWEGICMPHVELWDSIADSITALRKTLP